jgi:hypothetical protein
MTSMGRDFWVMTMRMASDGLICDFFIAVQRACEVEDVPFDFDAEEIELEELEEYQHDSEVAK